MIKRKISLRKYSKIHHWLKKNFGRANRCEAIGCLGKSTNYHWAKKKGKRYQYKRENFMQMCVSCHGKYDTTQLKRNMMREANKNTHATHCLRGHEFTKENIKVIRGPHGERYRSCRICANVRQKKWRTNPKVRMAEKIYQAIYGRKRRQNSLPLSR